MSSVEGKSDQALQGKLAIVTGASRGIGYGIAYELASRGAKVKDLNTVLVIVKSDHTRYSVSTPRHQVKTR